MNQPRHRLAEPRRTPKKNVSCFFDLAEVKFFLKMERTFFFGVLPSKYSGSAWGFNADEVLAKLFFGEMICQNFGSCVFEFGSRKWKRRGLGRNFPFAPLISFGEIRANKFIDTLYPDLGLFCNRIYHINTNEQICLYKRLQGNHRTLKNSAY